MKRLLLLLMLLVFSFSGLSLPAMNENYPNGLGR
jgi:hypothetical protein